MLSNMPIIQMVKFIFILNSQRPAAGLRPGHYPPPEVGASWNWSEGRRATEEMQQSIEANRSKLETYEALRREIGKDPANVALAWLLHNSVVTAPIIGPCTLEQLEGGLRALEIELTDDVMVQLDTIWPGPGGEAAEAYAW
jgi:aryl-alcohol dehydrogenase-like predicted oxidoreductase